jgi:hypothetical protein
MMENNMTQIDEQSKKSRLSVRKAVIIGQLIINIPVTIIIFGSIFIGFLLLPRWWWVFFIGGFVLAWLWWAIIVPRWRKWAIRRGAPVQELHRLAVATGLEWPTGNIFEKTEIK